MRSIYVIAKTVLVWLGEAREESDLGMDLISDMDSVDFEELNSQDPPTKAWVAMLRIFQRPWWTRVWIVQEISAARIEPLVGCGQKWLPWSDFEKVDDLIGEQETKYDSTGKDVINPISNLRAIRQGTQSKLATSVWRKLSLLLKATLVCECGDPRDKVFALLGLTEETGQGKLIPDYSKSVSQVYAETIRYLIHTERKLNELSFSQPSRQHELPTWVPDWSFRGYPAISSLYLKDLYHASGASSPITRFSDNLSTLTARGAIIDHIKVVDTTNFEETTVLDGVDKIENTVLRALAEVLTPEVNPDDLSDAFWRTLIANSTLFAESPAPAIDGLKFQILRGQVAVPTDFEVDTMESFSRRVAYTWPLLPNIITKLRNRRLFITRSGRMGIGPSHMQEFDQVCILMGSDMPLILRDENEHHRFIGDSYVHGIMNGEALEQNETANSTLLFQDFTLR